MTGPGGVSIRTQLPTVSSKKHQGPITQCVLYSYTHVFTLYSALYRRFFCRPRWRHVEQVYVILTIKHCSSKKKENEYVINKVDSYYGGRCLGTLHAGNKYYDVCTKNVLRMATYAVNINEYG